MLAGLFDGRMVKEENDSEAMHRITIPSRSSSIAAIHHLSMSSLLDPSLPSLVIRPSSSGSTVEVFDAQGRKIYLYGRTSLQHTPYQATLEDAHFGAAVSSISTSSDAQSKVKQIQLFNPDVELELRSVGRMSYTWQFTWESELYQWKQPRLSSKEFTCFCVRKPDPDVDVSRARLGDTKSPTIITFQQYNIDRFSIKDHKGLEIILLTTLLSFLDASQEREDRPIMISSSADDTTTMVPLAPPAVPPKPQNLREEIGFGDFEEPPDPNELTITSAHSVETYAQKSFDLLLDSSMLFVILRAKSPEMIPKTVKVAEEVKRLRHREGWESMDEEQEIFQYVVENIEDPTGPSKLETKPTAGSIRRPPKVIDLNDPVPATSGPSPSSLKPHQPWDKTPPSSISIYLSKIVLPDLQPQVKKPSSSKSISRPIDSSNPSPIHSPSPPSLSPQIPSSSSSSSAVKTEEEPRQGTESRIGKLIDGFGRLGFGNGKV